jgi:hypothetical protein
MRWIGCSWRSSNEPSKPLVDLGFAQGDQTIVVRSSRYRRAHRRNGWNVARKLTGASHRRQFKGHGASEMTIIERIELRRGGMGRALAGFRASARLIAAMVPMKNLILFVAGLGIIFLASAVQTLAQIGSAKHVLIRGRVFTRSGSSLALRCRRPPTLLGRT